MGQVGKFLDAVRISGPSERDQINEHGISKGQRASHKHTTQVRTNTGTCRDPYQ